MQVFALFHAFAQVPAPGPGRRGKRAAHFAYENHRQEAPAPKPGGAGACMCRGGLEGRSAGVCILLPRFLKQHVFRRVHRAPIPVKLEMQVALVAAFGDGGAAHRTDKVARV